MIQGYDNETIGDKAERLSPTAHYSARMVAERLASLPWILKQAERQALEEDRERRLVPGPWQTGRQTLEEVRDSNLIPGPRQTGRQVLEEVGDSSLESRCENLLDQVLQNLRIRQSLHTSGSHCQTEGPILTKIVSVVDQGWQFDQQNLRIGYSTSRLEYQSRSYIHYKL